MRGHSSSTMFEIGGCETRYANFATKCDQLWDNNIIPLTIDKILTFIIIVLTIFCLSIGCRRAMRDIPSSSRLRAAAHRHFWMERDTAVKGDPPRARLTPPPKPIFMHRLFYIHTVVCGYSDTFGDWQMCNQNQLSPHLKIFSKRLSFLGSKKLSL